MCMRDGLCTRAGGTEVKRDTVQRSMASLTRTEDSERVAITARVPAFVYMLAVWIESDKERAVATGLFRLSGADALSLDDSSALCSDSYAVVSCIQRACDAQKDPVYFAGLVLRVVMCCC